jgi:hypothetical protein
MMEIGHQQSMYTNSLRDEEPHWHIGQDDTEESSCHGVIICSAADEYREGGHDNAIASASGIHLG